MTRDLFGHVTRSRTITGEQYHVMELHRTFEAVLILDGDKEIWLPLSLIHIEHAGPSVLKERAGKMREHTPATITVPDRLAIEKGLQE